MNTTGMVIELVNACASGRLGMSDCGPIWQLGVIAALLVVMSVTLVALRLRSHLQSSDA